MRRAKKVMMWACCTAPAVAAMVMTGAGTAGASVLSLHPGPIHTSPFHPGPFQPIPGKPIQGNPIQGTQGDPIQSYPIQGNPACSKSQPETWNLNGRNGVENGPVTLSVTLKQKGSCLTGQMAGKRSSSGSIHGMVNGDQVTFSITYSPNSVQTTRTFTGTINRYGAVSGWLAGKGPLQRSAPWSLKDNAQPACSRSRQRHGAPRECQV